jgi:hypothetical protein
MDDGTYLGGAMALEAGEEYVEGVLVGRLEGGRGGDPSVRTLERSRGAALKPGSYP